jgi:UDP-glucose 4-epimerase
MKILITGSQGYIGSHLKYSLKERGHDVHGLDIIYTQEKDHLTLDITSSDLSMLNTYDTVIHLAALVRVNESVSNPIQYYNTNLNGTLRILENISFKSFVFASTGTAASPIVPYSLSKRCAEDIVRSYCTSRSIPFNIFRFYNVIGTNGKFPPTNPDGLFFNLIKAKETGNFNLYGYDYNTPDGTAVRDYVHVMEICTAIADSLDSPTNRIENLGHGKGYTVKQIAEEFCRTNNCSFKIKYLPRREGDLESSVLDSPSIFMKDMYSFSDLLKI